LNTDEDNEDEDKDEEEEEEEETKTTGTFAGLNTLAMGLNTFLVFWGTEDDDEGGAETNSDCGCKGGGGDFFSFNS
jgi:hypothetical protein